MPLIKIELEKGNDRQFLLDFKELVMDCVRDVLSLHPDDRNIRLMEYEHGFFQMKEPYKYLVILELFSGRSSDAKRNLYQSIVNTLSEKLGVKKEEVFILIQEQPKENWGIKGGVPASDIIKGFHINF